MILPFKPRFKEKILSGKKKTTIRKDPKNRWKKGNKIRFATGIRTKNYNCFMVGECRKVQIIKIVPIYGGVHISVDHYWLSSYEIDLLTSIEGFDSIHDLLRFFEYKPFIGKLIHWTDFEFSEKKEIEDSIKNLSTGG